MSLRIDDDDTNIAGVEYSLAGTWMDNLPSWAAFNLPVDVVVTLTEHPVPRDNVVNVAGCGRTVDLVGTGETQGVNLMLCGFNDTMSAWFWRKVDLDLGAIELYEHPGYTGSRTVIFLSDWSSGKIHSMGGWFMDNLSSSAKWHTLDDRVTCTIWKDEGSGDRKVLAEFNKTRQLDDLYRGGLNDMISYFDWRGLPPKKEVIKPFQIPLVVDMSNAKSFTATSSHENETELEQSFEVKLEWSAVESLTVSTTDSHRVGFSMTSTYTAEAGLEGLGKVTSSLSMTLSYDYTNTQTTEKSTAQTTSTTLTKTFRAAPHKSTVGTVTVRVGTVPPTSFETTARRWYDMPLSGSQLDPNQKGWYVRDEIVKGTLEGGLRATVESHDYYA